MFLFSLCKFIEIEVLGHLKSLCIVLKHIPNCFPKWLHNIASPLATYEGSILPASLSTLQLPTFGLSHLTWIGIGNCVLTCISLILNGIGFLSKWFVGTVKCRNLYPF